MSWDAVSAIAESLGALGVILSVLYLALEVRSNTQTLRADAGTRAQMDWSRYNMFISEHPHRNEMARVFDPAANYSDLTEDDRIAFTFAFRAFAQQVEAQYFQFRAKLLEPEVWEAHLRTFVGLISFPAVSDWWAQETTMPIYTRSFLDCVASAEPVELSANITVGVET